LIGLGFVDTTRISTIWINYITTEDKKSSMINTITTTKSISPGKYSYRIRLKYRKEIALVPSSSVSFIPSNCPRPNQIGSSCNVSSTPCDMQNPCQNMGTCINNITISRGYVCACQLGFNGTNCELDIRPCISTTCWNNGIYILCESFYKIVYFCLFEVLVLHHRIILFGVHAHLDGKVVIVKNKLTIVKMLHV
jgi:hypothetical protein